MSSHCLTRRLHLWLPPLAYMALIFYVSSKPDPLPELTAHVWDKLLHAIEYAGLAVLFVRALLGEGLRPLAAIVAAVLLAAAYAASDEYHQSFVLLRKPDVDDWMVDVIGGCLGAIAYSAVVRFPAYATLRRGAP
jgi:VanZ family protein